MVKGSGYGLQDLLMLGSGFRISGLGFSIERL
jgi:hypothetical protein